MQGADYFYAVQLNKNIKIFINYFLGPILFIWLGFSIYEQVRHQPQLEESWKAIKASLQSYRIVYLLLAVMLIFVNWGLEAWKWKLLVKVIYPINFIQAFKSVLSGVSFSVTMPNRIGEYVGRMMYMPEGSRLKTISAAVVGSMAQLIITVVTGIAGLLILRVSLITNYPQLTFWFQFIIYGLLFFLFLLTLFYFNVHSVVGLFKRWFKAERYIYLVESLNKYDTHFLVQLLVISFLRYGAFLLQYILIFYLFTVNVPALTLVWAMNVFFLALAIVPSIALVEVGLRGELGLKIVGIFTVNSLGIGLTSVTVWFINLILPAVIGSILLLNIKLTKK